MRLKLKLSQKGLILVAIPIAFELLFLIALAQLLHQVEQEAAQAAHLKEVVSDTNSLITQLYEVSGMVLSFSIQPDNDRNYNIAFERIRIKFNHLKNLVEKDPKQTELVDKIKTDLDHVLLFVGRYNAMRKVVVHVPMYAGMQAWTNEIEGPFRTLIANLNSLAQYQTRVSNVHPEIEERYRATIKLLVEIGLLVNIIFAISLALIVSKRMTHRVETLMDNTIRLAQGEILAPAKGGDDEIAQLDAFFHDMATTIKKDQRILSENEARVRSIVENMLVGIVLINDWGVIESINRRTAVLFGYWEEELVGQQAGVLFADWSEQDSFIETAKKQAFGRVVEISAMKKSGEKVPVEVTLSKFRSAEGERLLLNVLDVTERHKIERLKKEFIAMVSHDLRTPLASVLGSMTLLSQGIMGDLTDTGRNLVASSESELERVMRLINDLLDIAKMEAGKLELHKKFIAVQGLIEKSIDAVRSLASQNGIQIDIPQTSADIFADSDRLIQVLVYLLSNAVKSSPQGATIAVSVRETNDWLELRVTDQGGGIPGADRERVFEQFKHSDSSPGTGLLAGAGLGLAISREIITAHNGSLGVESEEGKGSTFWLRIPKEPTPSIVAEAP